jgi:uncharacterized protein (DUF433 family)
VSARPSAARACLREARTRSHLPRPLRPVISYGVRSQPWRMRNHLLRRGGWALRELPNVTRIEVDPDRLSGRPTIKDRRVPAEKVARIAAMPGGLRILETGYDVTKREADDAVRWYLRETTLCQQLTPQSCYA